MRLLYKALVESVEFHGHHLSVLSPLNFLFWGYAKHENVLNSHNVTTVKMQNTGSSTRNIKASIITTELQVEICQATNRAHNEKYITVLKNTVNIVTMLQARLLTNNGLSPR
jgi:hypothetical protein